MPLQGPLKWVAKLRALKTDKNVLLLKVPPNRHKVRSIVQVDRKGGHFGENNRQRHLEERAFEICFLHFATKQPLGFLPRSAGAQQGQSDE